MFDQRELWDRNIFKKIAKCFINQKSRFRNEISVVYEDGYREYLLSYNPTEYEFDYFDFIGKSKIEALFYCDRKAPLQKDIFVR